MNLQDQLDLDTLKKIEYIHRDCIAITFKTQVRDSSFTLPLNNYYDVFTGVSFPDARVGDVYRISFRDYNNNMGYSYTSEITQEEVDEKVEEISGQVIHRPSYPIFLQEETSYGITIELLNREMEINESIRIHGIEEIDPVLKINLHDNIVCTSYAYLYTPIIEEYFTRLIREVGSIPMVAA